MFKPVVVAFHMVVRSAFGVAVGVTIKMTFKAAAGVSYEQLEMHLKEIQNGDLSGYLKLQYK